MTRDKEIHIGTSGWHYAHWVGPFYPDGLSPPGFLSYYLQHFHTVEINNTFYQLPKKRTLAEWREGAPERFIFACKASRFITHMKKLKEPEQGLSRFFETIEVLGEKLGPVLFQLPPRWRVNAERLETFLKILPAAHRYAFEFRDESWFEPRIYEILARHNAAFCIYDFDRRQSPKEVTTDFVYMRLHGPNGPYRGSYSPQSLIAWAKRLCHWAEAGREVYCYFDNDEEGYAARNAMKLQAMTAKRRRGRAAAPRSNRGLR